MNLYPKLASSPNPGEPGCWSQYELPAEQSWEVSQGTGLRADLGDGDSTGSQLLPWVWIFILNPAPPSTGAKPAAFNSIHKHTSAPGSWRWAGVITPQDTPSVFLSLGSVFWCLLLLLQNLFDHILLWHPSKNIWSAPATWECFEKPTLNYPGTLCLYRDLNLGSLCHTEWFHHVKAHQFDELEFRNDEDCAHV